MITDDELDARLRHADPTGTSPVAGRGLDALLRSTEVASRGSRRRSLLFGLGIAGIVVVGGALAAPAASGVMRFLAQTDWSCGGGSECGDPDAQWIDSSAPDAAEYVASVYPDAIPFSSTWPRDAAVDRVSRALTENPGLISEVSVQRIYESVAYCSWVEQWLASDSSGETQQRDEATERLREAAGWPAMTATDGGGIMAMQAEFATSAEAGDRTGVLEASRANECAGWRE
jgi:hypothetical protein